MSDRLGERDSSSRRRAIRRRPLKRRSSLAAGLAVVLLCVTGVGRSHAAGGVGFEDGVSVGTVQSNVVDEASGCAASRANPGVLWMHNDSGDSARIHAVGKNGTDRGIFNLSGALAIDYEDVAVGPGPTAGRSYLYVGDIGDNNAGRAATQVYRLPEPEIGSPSTTLPAERLNFIYPDGPRDAETLMVDPLTADVYVVSKRHFPNRVYRFEAPMVDGGTYTGVEVARISVPWLTGGDISADGSSILIRDYSNNYLWLRDGTESVGAALSRPPTAVPAAVEPQGEAICWNSTGANYYTLSEGMHPPLHFFKSVPEDGGGGNTPTSTNSLAVGGSLTSGERLVSTSGQYFSMLQGDGNFVLYSSQGQVLWSSRTHGKGATRLFLQSDGDLVLYTTEGNRVWASQTIGKGATHLIMQDDGNLVLVNASGGRVWAARK